jgi:hypothetical protein
MRLELVTRYPPQHRTPGHKHLGDMVMCASPQYRAPSPPLARSSPYQLTVVLHVGSLRDKGGATRNQSLRKPHVVRLRSVR